MILWPCMTDQPIAAYVPLLFIHLERHCRFFGCVDNGVHSQLLVGLSCRSQRKFQHAYVHRAQEAFLIERLIHLPEIQYR